LFPPQLETSTGLDLSRKKKYGKVHYPSSNKVFSSKSIISSSVRPCEERTSSLQMNELVGITTSLEIIRVNLRGRIITLILIRAKNSIEVTYTTPWNGGHLCIISKVELELSPLNVVSSNINNTNSIN
jgi:hypothetical protein